MKKRFFIIVVVLILIIVLGPRLYIHFMATWDYYHTDVVCLGKDPTPPVEIGEQVPLLLYEVKPYVVITDYGPMYPGDEYNVLGETWSGIATLLWAGTDGADFVVKFKSIDHPEYTCRWFIPIGNYR